MRYRFLLPTLLLAAPLAFAHDLYLMALSFHVRPGQHLQVAFHNGDAFPLSEVVPPLVRLRDAQLSSASRVEPVTNLHPQGNELLGDVIVPPGSSLLFSVHTIPNFIELTPDKFLSYLKEEGLDDVVAYRVAHNETARPGRERYTKFAKSLLQSSGDDTYFQHPLGFPIEIVPLLNPYRLHLGQKLPVRILLHNAPIAGLPLEAARIVNGKSVIAPVGRTDVHGEIDVPLDAAGPWRLHALNMQRCADPAAADWESLWASLTFEVPAR